MDNHNNGGRMAEQVVGDIKKDFTIVGRHRVHSWYAWAIVGIVFGMALGIVYVANRSAQFSASRAAMPGVVSDEGSDMVAATNNEEAENSIFKIVYPRANAQISRAPLIYVATQNTDPNAYTEFSIQKQGNVIWSPLRGQFRPAIVPKSLLAYVAYGFNDLSAGNYLVKVNAGSLSDTIPISFFPELDEGEEPSSTPDQAPGAPSPDEPKKDDPTAGGGGITPPPTGGNPPPPTSEPLSKPFCACEKMWLKDKGSITSGGMAANAKDQVGITQLGENTGSSAIPGWKQLLSYIIFQEGSKRANYAFEIHAQLVKGSNPKLCTEYQKVEMTTTRNAGEDNETREFAEDSQQGVKNPSGSSKPHPYSDSDDESIYAADDYEEKQAYKEYRKDEIVWLDAPGFTGYLNESNPQSYEAKFIHFVTGCKCKSYLKISIDKAGAVTTKFETDCPKG